MFENCFNCGVSRCEKKIINASGCFDWVPAKEYGTAKVTATEEVKKMRDLKADKEICEKASLGPWGAYDEEIWQMIEQQVGLRYPIIASAYEHRQKWFSPEDAEFVVAAREGWPEAISRAIVAEAELEMLRNECEMCKNDKETMAIDRINELSAQVVKMQAVMDLLIKKKQICDGWKNILDMPAEPAQEFATRVYQLKDIDRQIDAIVQGFAELEGVGK